MSRPAKKSPEQRLADLLKLNVPTEEKLKELREAMREFETYRTNLKLHPKGPLRPSGTEYKKWIALRKTVGAKVAGISYSTQLSAFGSWDNARQAAVRDTASSAGETLALPGLKTSGKPPGPQG